MKGKVQHDSNKDSLDMSMQLNRGKSCQYDNRMENSALHSEPFLPIPPAHSSCLDYVLLAILPSPLKLVPTIQDEELPNPSYKIPHPFSV